VDVPFTIASHLGLAVPDAWVGRDMLDEGHSGRSFVVALSVLSDGQAAIVDASGAKLVRSPGDASWAVFDLARDPTEDRGRTPDAPLKAEAEARVATYERVAGQAWERSRRRHLAVPQAADGAEIAALWAPGPCVLTRLAPDGNLRVEPTHGHRCGEASDPFERRLVRAVDAAALAGGFELRVTLDVDAGAPSVDRELRTLVKLWGSENVFSAPLTREEGFQTVRLSLPAPPAANDGGDTVLAVVPADPSVAYTLHALEIAPAGRKP
jgi:hypothetical protein